MKDENDKLAEEKLNKKGVKESVKDKRVEKKENFKFDRLPASQDQEGRGQGGAEGRNRGTIVIMGHPKIVYSIRHTIYLM